MARPTVRLWFERAIGTIFLVLAARDPRRAGGEGWCDGVSWPAWFNRAMLTALVLGRAVSCRPGVARRPPATRSLGPARPQRSARLGDPAQARRACAMTPIECRAVLERSGVAVEALPPAGEGECRREDRTQAHVDAALASDPPTTCAVGAGFELWLRHGVQPAAEDRARCAGRSDRALRCLQLPTDARPRRPAAGASMRPATRWTSLPSCSRTGGGSASRAGWSGRAADGRASCGARATRRAAAFGTVLSPDYNAAHADHFHLDQAGRAFGGVCR